MFWTALAILMVLAAAMAVWGAMRFRRRAVRRVVVSGPAAIPGFVGSADGVYGLSPRELEEFRATAREQTRDQRQRWQRDYLTADVDADADGLPGRLAGIPRVLRIKR